MKSLLEIFKENNLLENVIVTDNGLEKSNNKNDIFNDEIDIINDFQEGQENIDDIMEK